MKRRFVVIAVFVGGLLKAADAPRVGVFVRGQALVEVSGVSGNFMVSTVLPEGVVSAAARGDKVLVKTEDSVCLFDGGQMQQQWRAPSGRALLALTRDGRPARAVFPDQQTEWIWRDKEIVIERPELEVIALSETRRVVRQDGRLWLIDAQGRRALPDEVVSPAFLPDESLVWLVGRELQFEDGRRVELDVAASRVAVLADDWLVVQAGSPNGEQLMVLRGAAGTSLWRLPAVQD
jgi:hypothetical protein